MGARVCVFCPFCNADGVSQPVLSPMTCVYILGHASNGDEEAPSEPTPAPRAGSHFEYRCTRCGYTEIHEHMLGEAA